MPKAKTYGEGETMLSYNEKICFVYKLNRNNV